jgi:small-conductance mechanosensitive channel
LFVLSIAFAWIAPTGLMTNVAISGGVVTLFAGVFALGAKDALGNIFYSVCLHTLPKCKEGDYVKVEGVSPAEGVIEKIDFLTSRIKRADTGQMVVLTNNLLWLNTVTIGVPPAKPKDKDDAPKVIVYCCHGGNCPGAQAATAPTPAQTTQP